MANPAIRHHVAHGADQPQAIQHHAPIKIFILSDEHPVMARAWARRPAGSGRSRSYPARLEKPGICPRLSLRRANVLGTVVEQTGQDDFTLLPTVNRADVGDGGTAYLFRQRQAESELSTAV
ncbi:hypothetical protein ELI41_31485 (plasmid) [Rhizobium leguminosarum]|nr:hypothetical protein ELI41_31485 [Rhizobium leguminosarum]